MIKKRIRRSKIIFEKFIKFYNGFNNFNIIWPRNWNIMRKYVWFMVTGWDCLCVYTRKETERKYAEKKETEIKDVLKEREKMCIHV